MKGYPQIAQEPFIQELTDRQHFVDRGIIYSRHNSCVKLKCIYANQKFAGLINVRITYVK